MDLYGFVFDISSGVDSTWMSIHQAESLTEAWIKLLKEYCKDMEDIKGEPEEYNSELHNYLAQKLELCYIKYESGERKQFTNFYDSYLLEDIRKMII